MVILIYVFHGYPDVLIGFISFFASAFFLRCFSLTRNSLEFSLDKDSNTFHWCVIFYHGRPLKSKLEVYFRKHDVLNKIGSHISNRWFGCLLKHLEKIRNSFFSVRFCRRLQYNLGCSLESFRPDLSFNWLTTSLTGFYGNSQKVPEINGFVSQKAFIAL